MFSQAWVCLYLHTRVHPFGQFRSLTAFRAWVSVPFTLAPPPPPLPSSPISGKTYYRNATHPLSPPQDRGYIQQKLQEKGVKCAVRVLQLGDFMWIARRRRSLSSFGKQTEENRALACCMLRALTFRLVGLPRAGCSSCDSMLFRERVSHFQTPSEAANCSLRVYLMVCPSPTSRFPPLPPPHPNPHTHTHTHTYTQTHTHTHSHAHTQRTWRSTPPTGRSWCWATLASASGWMTSPPPLWMVVSVSNTYVHFCGHSSKSQRRYARVASWRF